MIQGGFGIYFGNDQRHFGVHAPVAAFVDDDAAALDGPGDEFFGDFVGRAADGDIDSVKGIGLELFDGVLRPET